MAFDPNEDRAPEARKKWPDVSVKWEQPEVPRKGTPCQAIDLESGSIKSLRLTETDRRKQSAAKKQKQQQQQRKDAAAKSANEKAGSSGGSSPARGAGAGGGSARSGAVGSVRSAIAGLVSRKGTATLLQLPALPGNDDKLPGDGVPASMVVHLLLEPPPRLSALTEDPMSMFSGDEPSGISSATSVQPEPWDLVTSVIPFQPDARADASGGKADNGKGDFLGATELAAAMKQLKFALAKSRREVNDDLRREFDVQKSVWDSAALLEAAKTKATLQEVKRPEAQLKAAMEDIISGIEGEDSFAVETLERVCDEQEKLHAPLLSVAMLKLSRNSVKAKRLAVTRELFREHLEQCLGNEVRQSGRRDSTGSAISVSTVGAVSSLTVDQARSKSVRPEELLVSAQLSDPKLEYLCRRVLGLPMRIAKEALINGDWAAEIDPGGHSGAFRSQSTDPWCA